MRSIRSTLSFAGLLTIAISASANAAPQYTLQDLGAVTVTGINNTGQISAFSAAASSHAIRIEANGSYSDFGTGVANGINDAGQMAGYSGSNAIRWEVNGQATVLGQGGANAINAQGQVVGYSNYSYVDSSNPICSRGTCYYPTSTVSRATLWSAPGGQSYLGPALGYQMLSYATSINNNGEVSYIFDAGGAPYGRVLNSTTNTTISQISGPSQLKDINDSGLAVGLVNEDGPVALNSHTQQLTKLDPQHALFSGKATGINNPGSIVGKVSRNNNDTAFLVDGTSGSFYLLDSIVLSLNGFSSLSSAVDINDLGYIVGMGKYSDGSVHAFLAAPVSSVPVPAAAWLFGSALLGLGGLGKRRKH